MVTTTDDPELINWCAETTLRSSIQTALECVWDVATEEFRAIKALPAALNDETDNKDGIEEVKDNGEHSEDMEHPMGAFVTRCNVIAMKAEETEKETAAMVADSITHTVDDPIKILIQVLYMSAKEEIKVLIFRSVKAALTNVVQ